MQIRIWVYWKKDNPRLLAVQIRNLIQKPWKTLERSNNYSIFVQFLFEVQFQLQVGPALAIGLDRRAPLKSCVMGVDSHGIPRFPLPPMIPAGSASSLGQLDGMVGSNDRTSSIRNSNTHGIYKVSTHQFWFPYLFHIAFGFLEGSVNEEKISIVP